MKILTAFLEEDLPQDTCIVGDSKSLEAYLDSFDFSTHSIKELLEYGILLNWENTKCT